MKLDTLHLSNIPEMGVISHVFSPGLDQDKNTNLTRYLITHKVDELSIDSQGILGDRHRRLSRLSTGREYSLYPRGTQIRQHRHLCVVSRYDCRVLSEKLEVEVSPELLGANLLIDRLDGADFSISELPLGTHMLVIPEGVTETSGATKLPKPPIATIVHLVKQQGCGVVGNAIAHFYKDQKLVKAFREVSSSHRGIICQVDYPVQPAAILEAGQKIAFKFPSAVTP